MSLDITGLSSSYSDIISSQAQNVQSQKLQDSVSGDYSNATAEELMDACKQFEAYFVEMVFKEMEKTVDCFKAEESSSSQSGLVDYFKDTALQDLAATTTDIQGLGLAQTLYEQMKRNYGLE